MYNTNNRYSFLSGGGEMGELIRTKDWGKSPLGTPDTWPQSLCTMVAVMLDNPFPMYIAWGDKYTQIYNDGYRPILGLSKHPNALGNSTRETFSEIWHIIGDMFDDVMKGKAVDFRDFMLPLNRNGFVEECYFDFSYSPIRKKNGKVGGVLVTVMETTEKKRATDALKISNSRFINNIMQAPVAMCIFRGKNHVVEIANKHVLELWGKRAEDVLNKPIFEGVPEAKGQGLEALLDNVFTTGEKFVANERPVQFLRNGKIETTYINFVYQALKETDGTISGIMAVAVEVTEQVVSRSKIEESEHKIRALVENAPFAIAVYTGEDIIVEMANQTIIDIWGKGNEVIGKSFMHILPELSDQLVFEQIKNVFKTGKCFQTKNTPLDLIVEGKLFTYYFNYDFTPLYDLKGNIYGVMNTGVDLTDLNLAKKKIEESEENLRSTVVQSPIGIGVLDAKTLIAEVVNDSFVNIVGKTSEEITGKYYWDAFPELKSYYQESLNKVVETGLPSYFNDTELHIIKNGVEEKMYLTFVYAPLKNIQEEVTKVVIWVMDNTHQVMARQKIEEANKKFRETVKQAPVGISILRGKNHMVEMANEAYLKLVDKEEISFVGKPLFDSLPETKAIVESLLEDVLLTGVAFHGNEVPVPINRGGKEEIFYFDFLYHPLKEENGEISGIMVIATEVTEKVEARKKTEQNEQRLNIIVEASELGTWELILKNRAFTYSQRYLQIITGYTENHQLKHEDLLKHIHPEDLSIREEALKKAIETGHLHYETRVIWKDKSIHWVEAKGKVFYDSEHRPEKLIGTARDITELKKHQQELEESEQKFRLLASSMPQHVWTSDPQGNLNYFNQTVYNYTGLTPQQIDEGGWMQIVHPDDIKENLRAWMKAVATGNDFIFEHRFRRYDGEYRWQLSRAQPQLDEKGKIQMWVGTSTDIQDQKIFTNELERLVKERTKELSLINESLEKSEERYHLMVEDVQDYAIIYLNPAGIIENWNRGAQKIKGYKAEEIIGQSFSIFYTETDRKNGLPQKMLKLAQDKGKTNYEGWRVKKNGNRFWANVVITAVRNKMKELIGYSKVTHDLSEKKKADDKLRLNGLELQQKNKELELMNKELQSFAYISSHDLQEPLRKIQTFATQIQEREANNLSDGGKDKFMRMQNAAHRMQTLINDLLAYSRTNVQERVFEETEINTIIEEIKIDLKEELEQKNGFIENHVMGRAPIIPFQFRQLVYNLVSNSIRFSRPNVPLHVKITGVSGKGETFNYNKLHSDTTYYHMRIADNGIGFEQKYVEKIFQVFQRLHGRSEYAGTGIGLAIVKKIVENHNGFITARGEQNKGAIFDIYIPMANK